MNFFIAVIDLESKKLIKNEFSLQSGLCSQRSELYYYTGDSCNSLDFNNVQLKGIKTTTTNYLYLKL